MDAKTLCLGVLNRDDATGYEIKKQCEEGPFSHFYAAGFGSIYPALNSLCESGLATVREVTEDRRPSKKVYSITATGRIALAEAVAAPPGLDRIRSDFCFVLFFAHLLGARQIDEIIGNRIREIEDKIADISDCMAESDLPSGEAFVSGYGLAIYETELNYLKSNRHILVGDLLKDRPRADTAKATSTL